MQDWNLREGRASNHMGEELVYSLYSIRRGEAYNEGESPVGEGGQGML